MSNDGPQSGNPPHSAKTDSGAGLAAWSRIVAELAQQQDAATQKVRGAVVNPVCGKPYVFDTCCAAKVFAAEFCRTADRRWRERAGDALAAVQIKTLFAGISEPAWDALGWHDEPESLPPTGMAVETYRTLSISWDSSRRTTPGFCLICCCAAGRNREGLPTMR